MRPDRAILATLFEGAPRFIERLTEIDAGSREEFFDHAQEIALAMPAEEQLELLNAHPRIGAAPSSVSALSFREQGYDRDPGTSELQERLDRLNDEYESRHGFRFVIFVNGRSRDAIADLIPDHIDRTTNDERERALGAVIAIARSRATNPSREDS